MWNRDRDRWRGEVEGRVKERSENERGERGKESEGERTVTKRKGRVGDGSEGAGGRRGETGRVMERRRRSRWCEDRKGAMEGRWRCHVEGEDRRMESNLRTIS